MLSRLFDVSLFYFYIITVHYNILHRAIQQNSMQSVFPLFVLVFLLRYLLLILRRAGKINIFSFFFLFEFHLSEFIGEVNSKGTVRQLAGVIYSKVFACKRGFLVYIFAEKISGCKCNAGFFIEQLLAESEVIGVKGRHSALCIDPGRIIIA